MSESSILPALWPPRDLGFRALQREIDRVFQGFSGGLGLPALNDDALLEPKIDVQETGKAFVVAAELPGVEEKDVEISVSGNILSIKGEKRTGRDEKKEGWHITERSYGSFERHLPMPFNVEAAAVDARFDKGVLKLTVAKPAEAQPKSQKVAIKSAA